MIQQFSPEAFALLDASTIEAVTPIMQEGVVVSFTVAIKELVVAPATDTASSLWLHISGVESPEKEAVSLLEQALSLLPKSEIYDRVEAVVLASMLSADIDYGQDLEEAILEEYEVASIRQAYVDDHHCAESFDADMFYRQAPVEPEVIEEEVVENSYCTMLAEDSAPPEEISNLEDMSTSWWTPAAVVSYIKPLSDPARADGKGYVFAPSLCSFIFKLGEKLFSQKSFAPTSWVGKGWSVRLAMVDERTGKPDLLAIIS